jgi:ABC-type lipoprotein export system ATPase subunit
MKIIPNPDAPASSLIELLGIGKRYSMGDGFVSALEGIDLTLAAGEFVSVVGTSGSGKTTLLDILGCLSRPTSGTYLLKGTSVVERSDAELSEIRNKTLGFIFQTFHLMGRHTACANVEMPLFYAGVARKERIRRAEEALSRVGLADRMAHRPNQLSGGQQQRVAIARALVTQPDILLADEPTGNLDSRSGKEIIDLLLDLNREGRTLILVTHDLQLAALAPRCITLKDGRMLQDGRSTHPQPPHPL